MRRRITRHWSLLLNFLLPTSELVPLLHSYLLLPADCAERADSQTLLRILGEIDEDFRAPLVLYYMEDLSYKEIAAVLALPLGTVQSRIARAKIQLLRRLSETNLPLEQAK